MEIWKTVIGYEDLYSVSNFGRVKSHPINKRKKEILNGKIDSYGYLIYTFYRNGKCKNMKAQRAVAIHFIPNPENKATVNHKDGNKLNNHIDNLEWATRQEQVIHAVNNGLRRYRTGPFTEEHKRNLSASMMGRTPWNKGKKGVQVSWKKGLKFK
jgi:hypothetical protein